MPQVPKPEYGHQLDANTLALYKMGDTDAVMEEQDLLDEVGNNPLTAQYSANEVSHTWGPGKASNRDKFARLYPGTSTAYHRSSAALGAGNALRQYLVENGGTSYTLEVLARTDTTAAGQRGILGIAGLVASEVAVEDFISRLSVDPSDGTVDAFWERTGANQWLQVTPGMGIYDPDEWFVIHLVFTERSATVWNVDVYMSSPGNVGNLLGTFDEAADFLSGDGSKPNTTSAQNGHVYMGIREAAGTGWLGAIGSVRYVNRNMSAAEISAAATSLLATGDVDDGLVTIAHWRINEPPLLIDEADDGKHLNQVPSSGAEELPMTWGPGKAAEHDTFARYFNGDVGKFYRGPVLGTSNAFRQHIVSGGGEYTMEILARADYSTAGYRTLLAIRGDLTNLVQDDILNQISIDPVTGGFQVSWERVGVDKGINSVTTGHVTEGSWFVFHVVFETRVSDRWTLRVYVDGVLVETADEDSDFFGGNSLKPDTTSGTNSAMQIGGLQQIITSTWQGPIGSVRYVNKVMTPAEISTAASSLLTTGKVNDSLTALAHWAMNEPPSLVDETDFGFHMMSSNTDNKSNGVRGLDIVGTGGKARRMEDSFSYHDVGSFGFEALHGRRLIEFFTDAVDSIPEYTLECWVILPTQGLSAGTYRLWNWGPGGTASSTNTLFRHSINSSLETVFFAEFGAGTDIVQSPANTQIINTGGDPTDGRGRIHWAVRVKDVASVFTMEHFINGVLKATHTIATTPNGGEGANGKGLLIGPWDGWVQDVRVSKGARSDTEILASANNCLVLAGHPDTAAPTFTLTSPTNGSQLTKVTPITFDIQDLTPGVVITGVWVKYSFDSQRMLVYDGDVFRYPFAAGSTVIDVNSDQTLLSFTLVPTGGWLGAIEQLQVRAADKTGNVDLEASDGIFFLAP